MPLAIEQRQLDPDIEVVALSGDLSLGREIQQVESLVDDLAGSGHRKIVLDMSGIAHIDSAGVGLIALASGKLREAGGQVVVIAPEGRVLHLLKMTRMDLIVTVVATAAAAAAKFTR